ncbi:hypothetical protein HCJ12_01550 [Listeria welshimeri]|nr:hypothetical protein [Listeria welshimeri]MBC1637652.1 hypothetical protein [Listeria welshimeri]MBC1666640.1 hypothetical protein [Listeria welshimeri]MBC1672503.1 hypothetical protein [Listeria welshimeri]MBC1963749.1 hypothetical protein [Listeria welshimeri]
MGIGLINKKLKVELIGLRLSTPKHCKIDGEERVDIDRYDHEIFNKYLLILLEKDSAEIKKKIDNCSIALLEYSENDISSYGFGKFLVFKSGKTQRIVNEDDLTEGEEKRRDQGLKNEIHFVINKTTGVILVERDYEKIFNASLLNSFFYHNKKFMYDYVDEFNKLNYDRETNNSIEIHKNKLIYINPLPSQDLFDELEDFSRIKRFKVIKKVEKRKNHGIDGCVKELEDILNKASDTSLGQNVVSVEYYMDERGKGLEIDSLKEMIQKIYQSHYYEDFIITGASNDNDLKTLSKDNITKRFEFKMSVDIDGNYVDICMLFDKLLFFIQEYIEEHFDLDDYCNDKLSDLVVNP